MVTNLYGAEWLAQEVLQLRSLHRQSSSLPVLFQDLHQSRVCQDTPVHKKQQFAVEVYETFVDLGGNAETQG